MGVVGEGSAQLGGRCLVGEARDHAQAGPRVPLALQIAYAGQRECMNHCGETDHLDVHADAGAPWG